MFFRRSEQTDHQSENPLGDGQNAGNHRERKGADGPPAVRESDHLWRQGRREPEPAGQVPRAAVHPRGCRAPRGRSSHSGQHRHAAHPAGDHRLRAARRLCPQLTLPLGRARYVALASGRPRPFRSTRTGSGQAWAVVPA